MASQEQVYLVPTKLSPECHLAAFRCCRLRFRRGCQHVAVLLPNLERLVPCLLVRHRGFQLFDEVDCFVNSTPGVAAVESAQCIDDDLCVLVVYERRPPGTGVHGDLAVESVREGSPAEPFQLAECTEGIPRIRTIIPLVESRLHFGKVISAAKRRAAFLSSCGLRGLD